MTTFKSVPVPVKRRKIDRLTLALKCLGITIKIIHKHKDIFEMLNVSDIPNVIEDMNFDQELKKIESALKQIKKHLPEVL